MNNSIKATLFFVVTVYSILLNAQTDKTDIFDKESKTLDKSLITEPTKDTASDVVEDTVWVLTAEGKKMIVGDIAPVSVRELKISNKRFMPELTWESVLDVMNLKYEPVEGFVLNEKFEFCKPYSLSLHNSIKSSDRNFLAYIEHYFTGIYPIFTDDVNPPDSVVSAYDRYFNNINMFSGTKNNYLTRISITDRNMRYFYIIRDHLINVAGKYDTDYRYDFSMKDMEKNVRYLSSEYAQTQFNADTAICYSLPVKPINGDKKLQKKYSRCEVLLLQKNNLGPVVFYCFFTNKGYKNRKKYLDQLGRSLKFND
jgi:hypothetical protein